MTIETAFIKTLIDKAENGLAFQAALIAKLPIGATSKQAVEACEVLNVLNTKVVVLRDKRRRQAASERAEEPAAKLP